MIKVINFKTQRGSRLVLCIHVDRVLFLYQPRIGSQNTSSNADVSTAGLQSSSGQTSTENQQCSTLEHSGSQADVQGFLINSTKFLVASSSIQTSFQSIVCPSCQTTLQLLTSPAVLGGLQHMLFHPGFQSPLRLTNIHLPTVTRYLIHHSRFFFSIGWCHFSHRK